MKNQSKPVVVGLAFCLFAMLQGCAGTKVTDAGKTDQPVFPAASSAWQKEGTFPNLDNLRAVRSGMTKDQLYASLDRPHFGEGMVGVREWDYIFNFRTTGDEYVTCQYKVLFDKDMKARSFYWAPESCAAVLNKPEPQRAQAPVAPAQPAVLHNVTLSGDTLFAFNRSDVAGLTAEGQRQLNELAQNVKKMGQVTGVDIKAYADRIGSAAYNQRLSQARANTVRSIFVGAGVPATVVRAEGLGATDPVVQCSDKGRDALAKCLAPNRRVQIRVTGKANS